MLFLKRLESDGAKIAIADKDRDLLKNYGKAEEEMATRDLEAAMHADAEITEKGKEDTLLSEAAKEEERAKKDIMADKKRNPESIVEKLRVKRMKATCASTKAVAVTYDSKNVF